MSVCSPARHPFTVRKLSENCHVYGAFSAGETSLLKALFSLATAAFLLWSPISRAQDSERQVLILSFSSLQLTAATFSVASSHDHLVDEDDFRTRHESALIRSRIEQLRRAEAAITRAGLAMAELDESRALRELSFAETTLSQILSLPGAVQFYAEVQLQLGMSAAQLGLLELAAAAFMRAASIEPRRRLLAGEAAPAVVALAERAFERESRAPEGAVRISVDVPGTRVFLDDVELGVAPLIVRARQGVHALRLEAAGYDPYARLFELAEGHRPEQHVALSRPATSEALVALRSALLDDDAERQAARLMVAARALLVLAPELTHVAFAEERMATLRRLVVWCDRASCRAPERMQRDKRFLAVNASAVLSAESLRAARAWLVEANTRPQHVAADDGVLTRWYFWVPLSAAAIGAALAVTLLSRPDPDRATRVTVDPSALH